MKQHRRWEQEGRHSALIHYKTGLESRSRILQAAKSCFYENGYKKTTIAMIAERAEVPQSLVNYYFKKDALLLQIHEDYITSILRFVEEQVGNRLDNILQGHLLMQQIQQMGIYRDAKCAEVYRYMVDNGLLSPRLTEIVDTYLLGCIKEFGIDLSPERYRQYLVAQYGAHRELVRVYLRTYDPVESKRLFYFTGTISLRLAGVGEEMIEENIQKADRLLDEIDTSRIRFLP